MEMLFSEKLIQRENAWISEIYKRLKIKWKKNFSFMWWGKVKVKGIQLFPTLCIDPRDCTVHRTVQAEILEWVAFTFTRGSSQPRDQTQISAFQVDFLPAEPRGKSKNTGVGSLFLLQGIFLTQKLTQGLLHCRQTLYQRGNKNQ